MADLPRILVILGPTASGKSALAMAVAERTGADILSADSMTVYRGMDVGTAKPTLDERQRVRHHLIDVAEPNEAFTVAQFVEQADRVIADATAAGRPLVVTGGTPLYYKALFEGLFEGPPADLALRDQLAAGASPEELHTRLTEIDPAAAARIHANDTRRTLRALEVHALTGKPISEHQRQWDAPHRHAATWFGLQWDKDAINRRINARVKQMLAGGWVEETRQLIERYPTLSRTAGEATGYAELIQHLRGRLSLDDAAEQIKIATRQLARRQMKWFRRWTQVTWLPGDRPVEENVNAILAPSPGTPGKGWGGSLPS